MSDPNRPLSLLPETPIEDEHQTLIRRARKLEQILGVAPPHNLIRNRPRRPRTADSDTSTSTSASIPRTKSFGKRPAFLRNVFTKEAAGQDDSPHASPRVSSSVDSHSSTESLQSSFTHSSHGDSIPHTKSPQWSHDTVDTASSCNQAQIHPHHHPLYSLQSSTSVQSHRLPFPPNAHSPLALPHSSSPPDGHQSRRIRVLTKSSRPGSPLTGNTPPGSPLTTSSQVASPSSSSSEYHGLSLPTGQRPDTKCMRVAKNRCFVEEDYEAIRKTLRKLK
ncbi:hypothetical protein JAAARDRAFT_66292 [Jaapia argillacea MUCL 33604]|uniref:Uncharacterized protein n=1 Tax=Jaapia argillacea MUCL 33604 TaxID=933084 RepID=A0A067Q8U4_9AGAM|nr:hypothetical protein JAAARDRAFT_66292 [Jaapia argillacea MUCL 33604]